MRVLELLGAPGSGKTTLAQGLAETVAGAVTLEEAVRVGIAQRGEDALARAVARVTGSATNRLWRSTYARSADRFSGLTRFLGSHPESVISVLSAQKERAARDRGQDPVLGWVLNLMARYQLAVENDGEGWLIVDEGFAQRGLALFAYGLDAADRDALEAYLAAIPPPDVLVVLETPVDVCEQRLDRRGWSERVRDLGAEERRRFLRNAAELVQAVAAGLEAEGTRAIWVDGTSPTPVSIDLIAATLNV